VTQPYWFIRTITGTRTSISLVESIFLSSRKPAGQPYETGETIALIAGFGFLFSRAVRYLISLKPMRGQIIFPDETIRTQLGELVDIKAEALPITDKLIQKGRKVYIREGCWYCHSLYTRSVAGENRRWGPSSEVGEYAYDLPHLFGTRRIGPDLTRVGEKYGDDWHAAHYFDPRVVVPDSIMPLRFLKKRILWFSTKMGGGRCLCSL
jgi:cytochrome c oxidase cbb3-type subunit 2